MAKKKTEAAVSATETTAPVTETATPVATTTPTFDDILRDLDAMVITCEKDANAKLKTCRDKIRGNLGEYLEAFKKLQDSLNELNTVIDNRDFVKFRASGTPMTSAVKAFYHQHVKTKETRDKETNKVTNIELKVANQAVHLDAFCKYTCGDLFDGLSLDWYHDGAKLVTALALRSVDIYKMSDADLAKHSLNFIRLANAKKAGETPDSNTQIVKLIQKIINEAMPGTEYRVTNHDVQFLLDASTKLSSKEKCTIAYLSPKQFTLCLLNLFAHVLGEQYKVAYKQEKKD